MRRRTIVAGVPSLLAGCTAGGELLGGIDDDADGWPTFRADERRSGSVAPSAPAVETPAVRWRTTVTGQHRRGLSLVGPALALTGDEETWLLDPDDGTRLMTVAGPNERAGEPVTADGDLLVPAYSALVRVDPRTGRRRWTAELGTVRESCLEGHCTPGATPIGVPSVADELAVLVAPTRDTEVGDTERSLYGIDLDDGTVEWTVSVGRWHRRTLTPVVRDGTAYVQFADGRRLGAYDLSDGTVVWTAGPPGKRDPVGSSVRPLLAGNVLVYATPDGSVVGAGTDDGRERWRCDFGSVEGRPAGVTPLASDGERVYLTDGSLLAAVDAATGDALWSVPAMDGRFTGPAVADGTVYAGRNYRTGGGPTHENEVFAYDAATGDRRWRWRSSIKGTVGSVVIGPGGVYAPFTTGIWKHREEDTIPTPEVGVTCLADAATVTDAHQ